ncbi:hypothetical protein JSY14_04780 [Brachybacterium sp. EF45031]|uniref:hypothetical protein n=1 Tax=Brachybacterium sillae TaxID=2810536 RepID=UPI00217F1E4D|nr:hypothetical protein [Brachybacterium sillae]MCS6711366.1 hypothetical protein [Brachybacterium sillae]
MSTAPPPTDRWGRRALTAVIIALLGGLLCAGIIGATAGPMEAAHGRLLTDTPTWYQTLVWALGALTLLWSGLGLFGIGAAIAALVRGERPGRPVTAIVLAILAPVILFGLLTVLMLLTAPGSTLTP